MSTWQNNAKTDQLHPIQTGISYVSVLVDAFTYYVVLHPSPRKYAANALKVLFDHCKIKFGIPDILATDNAN